MTSIQKTILLVILLLSACGTNDTTEIGTASPSTQHESDTAQSIDQQPEHNDAASGGDVSGTVSQAMRINPDTTYRGLSIVAEDGTVDSDCYAVEMSMDDGIVHFELTSSAEQSVSGELYDANAELLTSSSVSYGESTTISFGAASYENAMAGAYTLCVTGATFDGYTEYSLLATLDQPESMSNAASDNDNNIGMESASSQGLTDACTLLSAEVIQETLDISDKVTVDADSGHPNWRFFKRVRLQVG